MKIPFFKKSNQEEGALGAPVTTRTTAYMHASDEQRVRLAWTDSQLDAAWKCLPRSEQRAHVAATQKLVQPVLIDAPKSHAPKSPPLLIRNLQRISPSAQESMLSVALSLFGKTGPTEAHLSRLICDLSYIPERLRAGVIEQLMAVFCSDQSFSDIVPYGYLPTFYAEFRCSLFEILLRGGSIAQAEKLALLGLFVRGDTDVASQDRLAFLLDTYRVHKKAPELFTAFHILCNEVKGQKLSQLEIVEELEKVAHSKKPLETATTVLARREQQRIEEEKSSNQFPTVTGSARDVLGKRRLQGMTPSGPPF